MNQQAIGRSLRQGRMPEAFFISVEPSMTAFSKSRIASQVGAGSQNGAKTAEVGLGSKGPVIVDTPAVDMADIRAKARAKAEASRTRAAKKMTPKALLAAYLELNVSHTIIADSSDREVTILKERALTNAKEAQDRHDAAVKAVASRLNSDAERTDKYWRGEQKGWQETNARLHKEKAEAGKEATSRGETIKTLTGERDGYKTRLTQLQALLAPALDLALDEPAADDIQVVMMGDTDRGVNRYLREHGFPGCR